MVAATDKARLDVLLHRRGYFPTRERARAAVLAGLVFVDGVRRQKAGELVPADCELEVRGGKLPFVSRGGLKLARALDVFGVDPRGKVCLDVGASTGGFTDCLLQRGAARVYAVDVGYGQLAWKLRQDERVRVIERTNARHLSRQDVPEPVDLATMDVSFISVEKIMPAVLDLLAPPGDLVILVKPQFEAGPSRVGKKGVVRDPEVHREVLERILLAARGLGLAPLGLTHSPIRGEEGNIEFLLWLGRPGAARPAAALDEGSVAGVVAAAHAALGR